MNILEFLKLGGGLDTRINFLQEQESDSLLFTPNSYNVELKNNILQRVNGNQAILISPTGDPISGMFEYVVNDYHYLLFTSGSNLYQYDGLNSYTILKDDMTPTNKVQFCQYLQYAVVLNGIDDPFLWNGITKTITPTGFLAANGNAGQTLASYQSCLFIGYEANLYYSDIGDPTQWLNDPAQNYYGGFIDNFMGNTDIITNLFSTSEYIIIFTRNNNYILSGYNYSNYQINLFGKVGMTSPNGCVMFNKDTYFFADELIGVYSLSNMNDLGSMRIEDSITQKIQNDIVSTLNASQKDNIIFVPYAQRNQLWMYVPNSITGYIDTAYIFDFNYVGTNTSNFMSIWKREQNAITSCSSFNDRIYTGDSTGQIYLEDSLNSRTMGGNSFNFSWFTPFIDFGKRALFKNCQYIKLFFNSQKVNNVNTQINYNGVSSSQIRPINLDDNFLIWDNENWDEQYWAGDIDETKIKTVGGRFTSVQIGLIGNSASNDFALKGFSFLNYQMQGGF